MSRSKLMTAALVMTIAAAFLSPAASFAAMKQDASGYYEITSSADLKEFTELVSDGYLVAKGKLMNDVVLSSDAAPCDWGAEVGPIGPSSSREFVGVLDGRGHSIKGLYIDASTSPQGLIGQLGAKGIVRNLSVYGSIKTTSGFCAGVVGICSGVIANCKNYVNLAGTYSMMGGVAGSCEESGVIKNCVNNGKIVSSSGGAVGGIAGVTNGKLSNCVNNGYISASDTAGGIAGNSSSSSGVISGCVNTGDIETFATSKWGGSSNVGGIAGNNSGKIANCASTGNVTAHKYSDDNTRTGKYVGGIIGNNDSTAVVSGCNWLKTASISPDHAIGGEGDYTVGSDSGAVSKDKAASIPVKAITLDSYVKAGHSFSLTAYAFPKASAQARNLKITTPDGLVLDVKALSSDAATVCTVAAGVTGTTYTAFVTAADDEVSADFTITPASPDAVPSSGDASGDISGDASGDASDNGSSSGCNAGFGLLPLLALVPFALRKKK